MTHEADDQNVIVLAPLETAPLELIHAKLHTFQIERIMSIFGTRIDFKKEIVKF